MTNTDRTQEAVSCPTLAIDHSAFDQKAFMEFCNKLYIVRAALEDMIDNDLMISTAGVTRSTDVNQIMFSLTVSGLNSTLTVETLDGENVGAIVIEDGAHHEVFASYDQGLAAELDRAFGLINEANDNPGFLTDNPFL